MFLDKAEDLPRFDLLSRSVQIDQKDSGVIIIVICAEPELIDVVCQLGFPCMGGRREEISRQIRLPERTEGIYEQDIRIQIKDPLQVFGKQLRR